MAEILAKQFASVFTVPEKELLSAEEIFPLDSGSPFCDIIITIFDVIDAIASLRPNAGPGPDGLPAILLNNAVVLLPSLCFCYGVSALMNLLHQHLLSLQW